MIYPVIISLIVPQILIQQTTIHLQQSNSDQIKREQEKWMREEYPKIQAEQERWMREEYPKIQAEQERWMREEYPKIQAEHE